MTRSPIGLELTEVRRLGDREEGKKARQRLFALRAALLYDMSWSWHAVAANTYVRRDNCATHKSIVIAQALL